MTTSHVDELAAVRQYLASNAQVAALCGSHIYADELPKGLAATMPIKAIVINDAGLGAGGGAIGMTNNSYMPVSNTTKDLRCYGETFAEARKVWGAAAGALKDLGLNGREVIDIGGVRVMLYSASPAAPASTREPEVDWPLTFGTFNLTAAENAV